MLGELPHPQDAHLNPFAVDAKEAERQRRAQKYTERVNIFARQIIYESSLTPEEMEKELRRLTRSHETFEFEKDQHEFAALLELFRGVEMHETANDIHRGVWQTALLAQPSSSRKDHKAPETLTREDVAREFTAFDLREQLEEAEARAIEAYEKLLSIKADSVIRLSDTISIGRTDIEALLIDLKTRIAERITDPKERRAQLEKLDRELVDIIQRIPDEERGKKFEMEEVYLLRRLIHAADTGHLASVSHGTPRDDLRRDRGSVDIELTAAGEVIKLQLKTFKLGDASPESRVNQARSFDSAKYHLEHSDTRLVVLEARNVAHAYENARRQADLSRTSRTDKYDTLQPIVDELEPEERNTFLKLVGLTEEDLRPEREERENRQRTLLEHQERIAQRRAAKDAEEQEQQRVAQLAREREERMDQERLAAIEAKRLAIEAHERSTSEAAAQRIAAQAQAKLTKQAEVERNLAAAQQRDQERRQAAAEEAKKVAAAEARKLAREKRKAETPDWPPKDLRGICSASLLMSLGLLRADWKGEAAPLLAAKQQFFDTYAKPKKGAAKATEQDKPNEAFAERFPTKESLTDLRLAA